MIQFSIKNAPEIAGHKNDPLLFCPVNYRYSRSTGLDALLIDRVVYFKFTVILRFLCTRKYQDASSLKHIVFMQKPFKNPGEILR